MDTGLQEADFLMSNYPRIFLKLSLFLSYVSLSLFPASLYLPLSFSLSVSICLSFCLFLCLSFCIILCLSLSFYLPDSLALSFSFCLSLFLSFFLCIVLCLFLFFLSFPNLSFSPGIPFHKYYKSKRE